MLVSFHGPTLHSMARAYPNKSKNVLTFTTTASKYIPKRPRICITWNPPFQTQIYLVKVPLNVNIAKQDLLHKKQFLKILWSEVWKGGFQLMLILVLLSMFFDAAVVFSKTFLLLFRLALAILFLRLWTHDSYFPNSFRPISYLEYIWVRSGKQSFCVEKTTEWWKLWTRDSQC